jgi:hypothetical protein
MRGLIRYSMRYKGLKEGCNVLKERYKAPRVEVRGVFLCENLAAPAVSVLGAITQEDWGGDVTVNPTLADGSGDFWLSF